MGIFDDGSQQTIVDTARQQIDKIPAVFVEVFSAAYLATKINLFRCHGRLLNPDSPQRYKLRHLYARPAKDPRTRSNAETTRELDAEIAQHERDVHEGEAQLAIEEQLSLKLRGSLTRAFLSCG
jgi:hypothetical protein